MTKTVSFGGGSSLFTDLVFEQNTRGVSLYIENKGLVLGVRVTLGSSVWREKCDRVQVPITESSPCETDMTDKPEHVEEFVLSEKLLPLGSVLGQGVTPLDVSMVLARVFHVQYTEVALLRLENGLLRFIFPEHLRTTGAIPISSPAVAAHTALSKKAEIFNNFAKVKHASIFEAVKPGGPDSEQVPAGPIQKLMSVPIMDRGSNVLGVIQISRKGSDPRFAPDFSREDLHDLELAAGVLASAPVLLEN